MVNVMYAVSTGFSFKHVLEKCVCEWRQEAEADCTSGGRKVKRGWGRNQ